MLRKLLLLFIIFNTLFAEKKAIIIGATSGMGREVAKLLSKDGYTVGLIGRRLNFLESLQKEIAGKSFIKQIDVTEPKAREKLLELINEIQGLDLILISISCYIDIKNSYSNNPENLWIDNEKILNIDLKGFISMADLALNFFIKQNHGHLIGISSTSGLIASPNTPIYSAAKACISRYMEGIRNQVKNNNLNIFITDIIPGFVAVEHSPLGEDSNAYWEITKEEAGKIIFEGIKEKKEIVYVPSKVWLISLLKYLPNYIYRKFFSWI